MLSFRVVNTIKENLNRIEERIQSACDEARRPRDSIQLMAVSKLQPEERITSAIELGLRLFGESRVQETKSRRDLFPPDAEVHLIGHLQRNKAKDAVHLYGAIQSIDAERTVDALDAQIVAAEQETSTPGGVTVPDLYIEVNTSGEASKSGVDGYDSLRTLVDTIARRERYRIRGLMTIGPLGADESAVRNAFAQLREMRNRLTEEYGIDLPELSMGMSGDLEAAVLEGSTMLRIGTAIFGERN